MQAELEHRFEEGHVAEAVLRALIYIRLPEGRVDERGFAMLKLIRASQPPSKRISLPRFKEMMREQFLLVCLDEERGVTTLPRLLGADAVEHDAALEILHRVLAATGGMSEEGRRRLARIETLFSAKPAKALASETAHA